MRWVVISLVAAVVLVPLCCASAAFLFFRFIPYGDGHTSLQGRVLDEEGRPLAGANVSLTGLELSSGKESHGMTTEPDGRFGVGITHYPTTTKRFSFEVNKAGYVAFKEEVTGSAFYEREVRLRKEKESRRHATLRG